MTPRSLLQRLLAQDPLNFLLTNRLPRRRLTQMAGWFSRIEHPWVCAASIAVWRLFADVDLSDARHRHFKSLHACFTRELRAGARPVDGDAGVLACPCDGLVGAFGAVGDGTVLQAKGQTYGLAELLAGGARAADFTGGCYATLRLTAGMYHRFHAPYACRVRRVTHVPGDTWNVNPSALRRIERLYCRNERAVLACELVPSGEPLVVVPVGAILVAGIRLHFLDLRLHLGYVGPRVIDCDAPLGKGQEIGWFEHGSTLIVLAPAGFAPAERVRAGHQLRAGEALFRRI